MTKLFDGSVIVDKRKIVIIKFDDGMYRIGYVFEGRLYINKMNYRDATFNNVRNEAKALVTPGTAMSNSERWEKASLQYQEAITMYSFDTTELTNVMEVEQAEAIDNIKHQTVVENKPQGLMDTKDPSVILSKSDDEIIADIQAGVHLNQRKPDLIPMEMEEPPIMAAGALADAGLLNNQNIGLPSDLLRAAQWPAYWKFIPAGWSAVDTYRIGQLFPVDDPSGRIIHARKKLLVPGVRTGGKSMFKDIKEARDTLTQWLEDNPE